MINMGNLTDLKKRLIVDKKRYRQNYLQNLIAKNRFFMYHNCVNTAF